MIKTQFNFEVKFQNGSKVNTLTKKLHKHLCFCDKFDLKGQGQGHSFQTCPKPLDD